MRVAQSASAAGADRGARLPLGGRVGGGRGAAPGRAADGAQRARRRRRGIMPAVPIPKHISFVTFDVYGTLIDWETGIYEAFAKEAERDKFELDRNVLIPLFHEISQEIEAGSYELYAEVLRRTVMEIAKRLEWNLEPSRSGFLTKLAKKHKLGLISNIDDKLLGQTRRHIPMDFDLVVTAQQVRSYKPDPAHFVECARRLGSKKGWVHVAASHHSDVSPCVKQRIPVIWVNRGKQVLESSQRKPTAEVPNLREAAKLLGV
jgi:2-haloacid dehalogenase/putative hydrolase of the HAD superfamily